MRRSKQIYETTCDYRVATNQLDMDDAGLLIELAGYPHVLAREAYALLERAAR